MSRDTDIALTARDLVFEHAKRFDAFQDNPWPTFYRELDIRYPESKFVPTPRPSGDWVRSLIRRFGNDSTPMREWIFGAGTPIGNEKEYVARFEQHNRDVLEHFADRTGDLLVMSICEGDGWSQLATFLDVEPPRKQFPHRNRAITKKALLDSLRRVREVARSLGR